MSAAWWRGFRRRAPARPPEFWSCWHVTGFRWPGNGRWWWGAAISWGNRSHANATVTICHSKTPDLAGICRQADILVAAMGRPASITGDFIQPGATVIDVGTNHIADRALVARIFRDSAEKLAAFDKRGSLLVGDVHPLDVAERAGAYSPVPGGVGPLTIAMLMVNTVAAAERRAGLSRDC